MSPSMEVLDKMAFEELADIKPKIEINTCLRLVRNLMNSLNLTPQEAMKALKFSSEMQKELAPLV